MANEGRGILCTKIAMTRYSRRIVLYDKSSFIFVIIKQPFSDTRIYDMVKEIRQSKVKEDKKKRKSKLRQW